MPKRVEEVRFKIDRVRLNDPWSATFVLASRWFRLTCSPESAGVVDSGGVALVTLRSNGRRGVGCNRGGPSEGMTLSSLVEVGL